MGKVTVLIELNYSHLDEAYQAKMFYGQALCPLLTDGWLISDFAFVKETVNGILEKSDGPPFIGGKASISGGLYISESYEHDRDEFEGRYPIDSDDL